MWKLAKTKSGVQRWVKTSNKKTKKKSTRRRKPKKRVTDVWGKNKPLEKFWRKLADGREILLVHTNGKTKWFQLPKTHPSARQKVQRTRTRPKNSSNYHLGTIFRRVRIVIQKSG